MAVAVGWERHWGRNEGREWSKVFRDLCYKFDISGAVLRSGGRREYEHALRCSYFLRHVGMSYSWSRSTREETVQWTLSK